MAVVRKENTHIKNRYDKLRDIELANLCISLNILNHTNLNEAFNTQISQFCNNRHHHCISDIMHSAASCIKEMGELGFVFNVKLKSKNFIIVAL